MIIREMEERDLPAADALEERCFSVPWAPGSFQEILGRDAYHLVVAEEEGKILGLGVLMSVIDSGDVMDLAVAPEARRKGIGRALLTELIRTADARGVRRLFLEVREHNEAAIRLYETSGFLRIGVRRDYYEKPREDALLYVRAWLEGQE